MVMQSAGGATRPLWLVLVLALACGSAGAGTPAPQESTLRFGRFGDVSVYAPPGPPGQVVLFVSGDGGWNLGVVDMARSLAGLGALVAGVDITRYLRALSADRGGCAYPAEDFEALGKYVQKSLGLPRYRPPVLVGYSSGATLVYAALAQAPPGTFRAAVSMGFCPDLPVDRPFCTGHGLQSAPGPKGKGVSFLPARTLEHPWIAFQGAIDQVCSADAVQRFVKEVGNGRIVLLPRVGHGFSVPKNWLPQFQQLLTELAAEPAAAPRGSRDRDPLADLPLIEVAAPPGGDTLAVILSGDGGWASLDRDLGDELARRGIPVVGLDTLQYFWTRRHPDGAGADLARILDHYLTALGKQRVLLVGYSFGADVLPFMARRLPPELYARVESVVLIGPAERASFEFHLTDWIGGGDDPAALPIRPEVEQLRGPRVVCIQGSDETGSLCRDAFAGTAVDWHAVTLPGGHHLGGNYRVLADYVAPRKRSGGGAP